MDKVLINFSELLNQVKVGINIFIFKDKKTKHYIYKHLYKKAIPGIFSNYEKNNKTFLEFTEKYLNKEMNKINDYIKKNLPTKIYIIDPFLYNTLDIKKNTSKDNKTDEDKYYFQIIEILKEQYWSKFKNYFDCNNQIKNYNKNNQKVHIVDSSGDKIKLNSNYDNKVIYLFKDINKYNKGSKLYKKRFQKESINTIIKSSINKENIQTLYDFLLLTLTFFIQYLDIKSTKRDLKIINDLKDYRYTFDENYKFPIALEEWYSKDDEVSNKRRNLPFNEKMSNQEKFLNIIHSQSHFGNRENNKGNKDNQNFKNQFLNFFKHTKDIWKFEKFRSIIDKFTEFDNLNKWAFSFNVDKNPKFKYKQDNKE